VQGILDAVTLPVRVMLRENESYEATSEADVHKLCSVARNLAGLPVDGVVLGFLSKGEVNIRISERILACAPNLKATFHHAFEDASDQLKAIRMLKQIGQVDRILTSGGSGEWPEKVEQLARYADAARPEIEILAGGGMDQETIEMISRATSIREFHIGRAVREPATASGRVRSDLVRALVESSAWQG
jgi:copper homeostasis protein